MEDDKWTLEIYNHIKEVQNDAFDEYIIPVHDVYIIQIHFFSCANLL